MDSSLVLRPIDGFPGYFIRSDGRVFSSRRPGRGHRTQYPELHELAQSRAGRDYHKVNLCVDGREATRFVHSLVATAFCGPRPPGAEARHLDGDKSRNGVDNICWGTKAMSQREIGKRFGISQSNVSMIVTGRCWSHISKELR